MELYEKMLYFYENNPYNYALGSVLIAILVAGVVSMAEHLFCSGVDAVLKSKANKKPKDNTDTGAKDF